MKKILAAAAAMGLALLLLTGCTQTVPTVASTQPKCFLAQLPVASAESAQTTVKPTAAPTVSAEPSQPPSASAGASASALQSPLASAAYKVAVPYDMEQEKSSQKSVDNGHSPWRLDAAFVAQVFVSLQVSPEGIVGDYPIPYEDFLVTQLNDSDATVAVNSDKSPTTLVYLKRLVRQEEGGIWTVVGYDPK